MSYSRWQKPCGNHPRRWPESCRADRTFIMRVPGRMVAESRMVASSDEPAAEADWLIRYTLDQDSERDSGICNGVSPGATTSPATTSASLACTNRRYGSKEPARGLGTKPSAPAVEKISYAAPRATGSAGYVTPLTTTANG